MKRRGANFGKVKVGKTKIKVCNVQFFSFIDRARALIFEHHDGTIYSSNMRALAFILSEHLKEEKTLKKAKQSIN